MPEYTELPASTDAGTLPNNIESERSVLGCMLRSPDSAALAFETLSANDFYDPANKEIFDAMTTLVASSRPIDIITVDEELSRRGNIELVGGPAYIVDLARSVPTTANIRAYIRIVDEKSTLRKLLRAAEQITKNCYAGEEETQAILESAEKAIYDITMRKGGEELLPIQPVMVRTFEHIEELVRNKGQVAGVESGYSELDELLTGFHPGEMILVAGRPAMGKTSIGMNFIENAAIRGGKKAAVFSLEMPAEQLTMRMLCTEARVDMQRVRRGVIENEEWDKLCNAMISIGPAQIYVDATAGLTVSQMRSKARRLQLEHGLDIIMIDYLSLMHATGNTGSRQEEVAQISRELKALALELGVPIIALQQLSRAPTGRTDHRPMLSDIRESGAIEQDADVVMFIHREDYYNHDTPEKNIAELIVAKQRNGSPGTVKLGWKGEFTWFMDLSPNGKEVHND